MEFQEFKQTVQDRCRNASACQTQFKRLLEAESFEPFFEVLKDNISWVLNNNILDAELLLQVKEEANKADIWVNEDRSSGILYVFNATVRAWGNATVRASENATVRASENATVEAWGNATVEAWENATVRAWENATVEAWENATVRASENAFISSYYKIECKLTEKSIYRCVTENTISFVEGAYIVTPRAPEKAEEQPASEETSTNNQ